MRCYFPVAFPPSIPKISSRRSQPAVPTVSSTNNLPAKELSPPLFLWRQWQPKINFGADDFTAQRKRLENLRVLHPQLLKAFEDAKEYIEANYREGDAVVLDVDNTVRANADCIGAYITAWGDTFQPRSKFTFPD